jgi:hypothetical protein
MRRLIEKSRNYTDERCVEPLASISRTPERHAEAAQRSRTLPTRAEAAPPSGSIHEDPDLAAGPSRSDTPKRHSRHCRLLQEPRPNLHRSSGPCDQKAAQERRVIGIQESAIGSRGHSGPSTPTPKRWSLCQEPPRRDKARVHQRAPMPDRKLPWVGDLVRLTRHAQL